MKFTPDRWTLEWLEEFIPDSESFDWDEGNIKKNLKHGVSDQEIESIFREYEYVFVGRIIEPEHSEWRGLILAQSEGGRYLALIFTKRGEKLRPISCRSMRQNERRLYEKTI